LAGGRPAGVAYVLRRPHVAVDVVVVVGIVAGRRSPIVVVLAAVGGKSSSALAALRGSIGAIISGGAGVEIGAFAGCPSEGDPTVRRRRKRY
jgi:hypothetical protein